MAVRLMMLSCAAAIGAFVYDVSAASRQKLTIPATKGLMVERVDTCAKAICPAVVILNGSKGFGSTAYDEIGKTFQTAGLSVYLLHALSDYDLAVISSADGARARINYYSKRMRSWVESVHSAVAHLKSQSQHGGKIGLLGISLGAQIASVATVGRNDIGALALIDGGFPKDYSQPVHSLPPLLLTWGTADQTFPISVARQLQRKAQQLGGTVTLDLYEGGAHDFFLKSGTTNARAARKSAAEFFSEHLSR